MKKSAITLLLASALGAASTAVTAGPDMALLRDARIQHVLLVSVDGLHALDVARFIESHPGSAMAELAAHAVTYSNASTPAHTDPSRACLRWSRAARPSRTGCSTT